MKRSLFLIYLGNIETMRKFERVKRIIINPHFIKSLLIKSRQTYLVFNILIIMFIMLLAFSCGKVERAAEVEIIEMEENIASILPNEVENVPYESKAKFRMHMKSLDDIDDALEDSIYRQDWNKIKEYAMKLKNTSAAIFTGKKKGELPKDFVMLDAMFHLQVLAVAEASQSREMVRLNIEYEKLQQTCDNCHVKYKNKEH